MADNNNNNAKSVDLRESYQPVVERTYTPLIGNGNYQAVIPPSAAGQQPAPPIGDSGVPPSRNGGASAPTRPARNRSAD